MVRLVVSTDSPPLSSVGNNHSPTTTQVITQVAANSNIASGNVSNSYVVSQTDTISQSATSPVHTVSLSQMQQNAASQLAPPQALSIPHHMPPPPFHHQTPNGAHLIHDNGHHHNGTLYIGAAEFYPSAETAYFLPPEMCPAHAQLCTAVHPEYGKRKLKFRYTNMKIKEYSSPHSAQHCIATKNNKLYLVSIF